MYPQKSVMKSTFPTSRYAQTADRSQRTHSTDYFTLKLELDICGAASNATGQDPITPVVITDFGYFHEITSSQHLHLLPLTSAGRLGVSGSCMAVVAKNRVVNLAVSAPRKPKYGEG